MDDLVAVGLMVAAFGLGVAIGFLSSIQIAARRAHAIVREYLSTRSKRSKKGDGEE